MNIIKKIREPRELPGEAGAPSGFRKGTACTVIEDGGRTYVEKEWLFGDWLFSAEYGYSVEKHIYQEANSHRLSVPQLFEFDDTDRKLRMEYVEGLCLDTPCSDLHYLSEALEFYDVFKTINFPATRPLCPMDGHHMHDYRLDQLKHSKRLRPMWEEVDAIYTTLLNGIPHVTIPFDAILKNALVRNNRLLFTDFDWTISGPHEFSLARLAFEFSVYDNPQIHSRVYDTGLYHFFLLHFYGRDPERIDAYLRPRLREGRLREFLNLNSGAARSDEA
jgi:hypothetical protein